MTEFESWTEGTEERVGGETAEGVAEGRLDKDGFKQPECCAETLQGRKEESEVPEADRLPRGTGWEERLEALAPPSSQTPHAPGCPEPTPLRPGPVGCPHHLVPISKPPKKNSRKTPYNKPAESSCRPTVLQRPAKEHMSSATGRHSGHTRNITLKQ